MISEYNKYKDNVSKNKETLLEYLKFNDEINLMAEKSLCIFQSEIS